MRDRYQKAVRTEKSLILDELLKNEVTGHRKSGVRLMAAEGANGETSKRGRKILYNEFVVTHLRKLGLRETTAIFQTFPKYLQGGFGGVG